MMYPIAQGAPVVLVHVHSNGCDIGDMKQMLQSISEQLRVHVMSFELPGYGLHLADVCNRRTIDAAASAVREFLLEELGLNPAQVVWYGRSIGSGPAVYQAYLSQTELKKPPAGLVLQCAYANFPELAGHLFGSWVKGLVPVNWPNEVMIKELKCPVLLLHGRADTMIPISQAERNFAAVTGKAKELSRFHACDCGHNDFNFQRCTLRPIYDFLLGIISSDDFPSTNFNIDIAQSSRAFVYHVGPLRTRIPVYGFRHPELADWIRRLQLRKQQQSLEAGGELREAGQDNPTAQAIERRGQENGIIGSMQKQALEGAEVQQQVKKKKKKGKAKVEDLPTIPNFCELPPLKEVEEALLDPEGMIRTCALRIEAFLKRLQLQLDQVEGLETKPVEEVIEIVEAEFWASDPMLCLWEEVRIPQGDWVRIRLGPFYIESRGESGYDADLGVSRHWNQDLLRVPLWVWSPSPAHFRCLAEWVLLRSERLEKLPTVPTRSSCCCAPCCGSKKSKKKHRGRRGFPDLTQHPSRGTLSTSLAALFANWVDKTEEIRAMFTRFAELHRHPDQALGRGVAAALSPPVQPRQASRGNSQDAEALAAPPQPHQPPDAEGDSMPVPRRQVSGTGAAATPAVAEVPNADAAPAEEPPSWWYADVGRVVGPSASSGQPLRPPWDAHVFSAVARLCLRESAGVVKDGPGFPGGTLSDFYGSLWNSEARQEVQPPIPGDLKVCDELPQATPPNLVPDRNTDWVAASVLLHFARLPRKPLPSEQVSSSEKVGVDFMRPEMRTAAVAVSKVMKAFAHAENRERRDSLRRFRQTPKVPMPPDIPPDGDMAESKPAPTMGKPANPASDKDGAVERPDLTSLGESPVSSSVAEFPAAAGAPPPSSRTL
jgi:pimeloyl-ACP methyl ester carboxylesterase